MDPTDMKVAVAELSALNKMIKLRELEISQKGGKVVRT